MLYVKCLSLEGRLCDQLKMYIIILKATTKIKKQGVIANKPTTELRRYHKNRRGKEEQRLDGVLVRALQRNNQ